MFKLNCGRAPVPAAAELFHEDLDIHRADGARRGVNTVLSVLRPYHRGFHTGDVQQFVRCLGRHNTLLRFFRDGDRHPAIQLRVLHELIPGKRRVHIDLE